MRKFFSFLIIIYILIFSGQIVQAGLELTYDLNRGIIDHKFTLERDQQPLYIPEFHVRGIYVSGWAAGSKIMDGLINLTDNTVINTMVIDIKDQDGYLSYNSSVPIANEIGANKRKIKDIKKLLNRLHNKGIYVIARIAIFKDSLLATNKKDLSLKVNYTDKEESFLSDNWLDPTKEGVWKYNMSLIKEAVSYGFDEIQLDYIRYPALTTTNMEAVIPENTTAKENIMNFLKYMKNELDALGIPLSVDVFGLTTTVEGDLGIGQDFTEISKVIKIISPMIYPSHYSKGIYGIKIPANEPSKVVSRSLTDARKKISGSKGVIIRPWLQDFSLEQIYTSKEVLEQIKAVEKLGLKEWLLWNPRSRYTEAALKDRKIYEYKEIEHNLRDDKFTITTEGNKLSLNLSKDEQLINNTEKIKDNMDDNIDNMTDNNVNKGEKENNHSGMTEESKINNNDDSKDNSKSDNDKGKHKDVKEKKID